jgi:light-regulated signal transduction histidine kinase (bacteriophytochrome)
MKKIMNALPGLTGGTSSRVVADPACRTGGGDRYGQRPRVTVNMPDVVIKADPEGLNQVLRNLLDNALKFTGKTADPQISIGGEEKEETCLLWVRDNGVGFDMQYHDRIFGIFQRLQKADDYSGTGIGLAIVQKAMQRMGGKVWAESTPGMGATFYLEVPK